MENTKKKAAAWSSLIWREKPAGDLFEALARIDDLRQMTALGSYAGTALSAELSIAIASGNETDWVFGVIGASPLCVSEAFGLPAPPAGETFLWGSMGHANANDSDTWVCVSSSEWFPVGLSSKSRRVSLAERGVIEETETTAINRKIMFVSTGVDPTGNSLIVEAALVDAQRFRELCSEETRETNGWVWSPWKKIFETATNSASASFEQRVLEHLGDYAIREKTKAVVDSVGENELAKTRKEARKAFSNDEPDVSGLSEAGSLMVWNAKRLASRVALGDSTASPEAEILFECLGVAEDERV